MLRSLAGRRAASGAAHRTIARARVLRRLGTLVRTFRARSAVICIRACLVLVWAPWHVARWSAVESDSCQLGPGGAPLLCASCGALCFSRGAERGPGSGLRIGEVTARRQ